MLSHFIFIICTCSVIQDMFEENRSILEPAGALALAGAEAYCKYYNLKDINVVAIASGANMNFDRLRLVTDLADVGRQREAVVATFIPEKRGRFKQFCELVCYLKSVPSVTFCHPSGQFD